MKKYPEIQIIEQPNRYTCYPTCVSILTGIPLETLFKTIGRDGSDEKGFEYEEIALSCLLLGWSLICLSIYEFESLVENLKSDNKIYRMILCVSRKDGYHTLAWDGKSEFAIDPLKINKKIPLQIIKNKIATIDILTPIEERELNFTKKSNTMFKSF